MSDEHAVESPPHEAVTGPEATAPRAPAPQPSTPRAPALEPPAPRPRRRGPGAFTLLVLPGLVTLSTVAGFLALTGGFPDDGSAEGRPSGTY
ncbi:hypothetical protein [Streptomyces sp. NPDC005486]|uniref:hypothetical protein n=1 Tax=Streptomyces sp. NPDC005486 TaxID=3155345 RepID=UPI0033B0B875